MAETEWWQRGPIEGVPAMLQPVAHILLQVRESVGELTDGLTAEEYNARPAGVASVAFHVQHIPGVIDRLFTYARGQLLNDAQFAALKREREPLAILGRLSARADRHLFEHAHVLDRQALASEPAAATQKVGEEIGVEQGHGVTGWTGFSSRNQRNM